MNIKTEMAFERVRIRDRMSASPTLDMLITASFSANNLLSRWDITQNKGKLSPREIAVEKTWVEKLTKSLRDGDGVAEIPRSQARPTEFGGRGDSSLEAGVGAFLGNLCSRLPQTREMRPGVSKCAAAPGQASPHQLASARSESVSYLRKLVH